MKHLTLILSFLLLAFICSAQMTRDEKIEMAYKYYDAKDYEKAYPLFIELAESGYARAQCVIGHYYFHPFAPVEKNYAEAYKWYLKSSKQGNKYATTQIGYMYAEGLYVVQNYEKAYEYYSMAVNQGSSLAASNIGWLYLENHLSDKGGYLVENAYKWFEIALALDSVDGAYRMAGYYGFLSKNEKHPCTGEMMYGTDLHDDWGIKSDSLFHVAAKRGHPGGQAQMGVISFHENNYKQAREWFTLAKDKGETMVWIDAWVPIDVALLICEYLSTDTTVYHELGLVSGHWIGPCDDEYVVETDKGYIEFLISANNSGFGKVRLSLDGKVLLKLPPVFDMPLGGVSNEFDVHESTPAPTVN